MSGLSTLQIQEKRIVTKYLCVNPEAEVGFYETIDAIYTIAQQKLYSVKYRRVNDYIEQKLKISRSTYYLLVTAGSVVSQLKQAGFKDVPANVALCLSLQKAATVNNQTLANVWKQALHKFGDGRNVVASKLHAIFQQDSVVEHVIPSPTDSTPNSDTRQSSRKRTISSCQESSSDSSIEIENDEKGTTPQVSNYQEEFGETSSSGSVTETENEQICQVVQQDRYRHIRNHGRPKFAENEYLTPSWLSNLLTEFTAPMGGIDLDLCGNRDSLVKAKHSYGEQKNGTFIDAFKFKRWAIPDTNESFENASKIPNVVYLNPPTKPLNENQIQETDTNHLQPEFIRKLLLHINEGFINHALILIPLESHRKWQHELLKKSIICMFKDRVEFERSRAAIGRFKKRTCQMQDNVKMWKSDPNSRALFWISKNDHRLEDIERFCKVFGGKGFIPGYNLKAVNLGQ